MPVDSPEAWQRKKDILLYLCSIADGLRADGLIGGGPDITDKGRERIAYLEQSGFVATITEDEVRWGTAVLVGAGRKSA